MLKDPLARVEARLRECGVQDFSERAIREEIQTALDRARKAPLPLAERVLQHVYAEAPCAF